MKLLTQDQAAASIERVKQLGQASELTQEQAREVMELLDDLQYTYLRHTNKADNPDAVREAANQLNSTLLCIAIQHSICTCCYLPLTVCSCDDHWMNHVSKTDGEEDFDYGD